MKPLGLVPGDCEAYEELSACVRLKFLSGGGGGQGWWKVGGGVV